jgi:hypothetical protein
VQGHEVSIGDIPLATTLEIVLRVLLPPQPRGSRLSIGGVVRYVSPAGHALAARMNEVVVRYDLDVLLPDTGVVRPVVRRVLEQMEAASVLATSKAASRSAKAALRESKAAVASMRSYAALLGDDPQVTATLDERARMLRAIADPSPEFRSAAKAATYTAMRRQRGSKDFGET